MNHYAKMIYQLKSPETMRELTHLYGQRDGILVKQTTRYTQLIKRHEELINSKSGCLYMISAPGRTEIGGNHTDHNNGKVLAAAVNLDALSAVTKRDDMQVNLYSEGYAPLSISLDDLSLNEDEKGTTTSLLRGVASKLKELGFTIGGFDAVIQSTVRGGSGLSSSASIEVLFCSIFDTLYNDNSLDFKTRAIISQYAENVYFGKPSGLMDQMASSCGGLAFIDFKDADAIVKPIAYDFSTKGYSLVVVATGGSHDDLTDDYAAIPVEMRAVASFFGEQNLRPVSLEDFMRNIPAIRKKLDIPNKDRAILRAYHYFTENTRVVKEADALMQDDIDQFLNLIIESGRSSYDYLQNIFCKFDQQQLSLALMMSEHLLHNKGAWRIHGGGFAGTILAFVPDSQLTKYLRDMREVFGDDSCDVLDIRPVGPACIPLCV